MLLLESFLIKYLDGNDTCVGDNPNHGHAINV